MRIKKKYPEVKRRNNKSYFGNLRVTTPDPVTAFFLKVEVTDSCWLWRGKLNDYGYGIFHEGRNQRAHRWLYETFYGPIGEDKICCHKCDTPACVNPAHIFIGTKHDNMSDAMSKGRVPVGSKRKHSKLTEEKVSAIKNGLKHGGGILKHRVVSLSKEFGVHYNTIWAIHYNRSWRHVE
jgi:hypothetical protein